MVVLIHAFRVFDLYQVVCIFVGVALDLTDTFRRAERLGVDIQEQCPMRLGKDIAILKCGIHSDL